MRRTRERLEVIEYRPGEDRLVYRNNDNEAEGRSHGDLLCGNCGEVVLSNWSKEEAQTHFVMHDQRVVIQCLACKAYNLLAAPSEKVEQNIVLNRA